jgi:hypothetical protein
MKEEIVKNLHNPHQLEKLYRDNKTTFKIEFESVYPEIHDNPVAQFWYERLNFEQDSISWGSKNELLLVIVISLIAGIVAKIPNIFSIDPDFFYPRNLSFIFFPMLTAYFAWKQKLDIKGIVIVATSIVISIIYINLLPADPSSDTLILACIHLLLFLWAIFGYAFVGNHVKDVRRRLYFLTFNGDLLVMTTIILLAGGLLTAITIGLFELIDLSIAEFYFENIAIWGLAASPIVGAFLVQSNPQLVNKVSPIIARVFTPLVIVMLITYLTAVFYTGKDPYNDRDFLIVFNGLLIGVLAIILFSISEISRNSERKLGLRLLIILSVLTILINGIALSAIVFRIAEWGITPNRMAVLGSNILILSNLLMVTFRLIKSVQVRQDISKVGECIASFLIIYAWWIMIVIFLFPFIFGFR